MDRREYVPMQQDVVTAPLRSGKQAAEKSAFALLFSVNRVVSRHLG